MWLREGAELSANTNTDSNTNTDTLNPHYHYYHYYHYAGADLSAGVRSKGAFARGSKPTRRAKEEANRRAVTEHVCVSRVHTRYYC